MKAFFAIAAAGLLTIGEAWGATNMVALGANMQQKIDAAAEGDTLVVQSGAYTGNLLFDKSLTVVCSGGDRIEFTGPVSINTTGRVAFANVLFLNGMQAQTSGTIALTRCSSQGGVSLPKGGTFLVFDSTFSADCNGIGGKWTVKRSTFNSDVNLTEVALEALRMTNAATVRLAAPVDSTNRSVVVQSSFYALEAAGGIHSYAYSSIRFVLMNDLKATLVGDRIGYNNTAAAGFRANRSDVEAYNTRFEQSYYAQNGPPAVYYTQSRGSLINCTIGATGFQINNYESVTALFVEGPGPVILRNTVIKPYSPSSVHWYAVNANASGGVVELNYCNIQGTLFGVTAINSVTSNSMENFDQPAIAPNKDAGSPDAIYKDVDGSRNDIGFTGGPLWNPTNYTNNNPIVLWSLPTPQTVIKGQDTTIKLSVGAAAGH